MAIQDLIDDFALFDTWEDRYRHVIDLGESLEPLAEDERNADTKVKGCVSQVWLKTDVSDSTPPTLHFRGDSDAHIVRGLIAILLELYSDRTPDEILATDAETVFKTLGLTDHLSRQRSNGLSAMVTRIRRDAEAA